jgi:beta-phosphoglucomutase-like phosphatase (HAD superfamily)
VGTPDNHFEGEKYYCVPTIENSSEMVKQMEQERATQLHQMGLMDSVSMLKKHDVKNPERMVEKAREEQGIMETIELLKENPEVMEQVEQLIAQKEQGNVQK